MKAHINLVDLQESKRNKKIAKRFKTLKELQEYTRRTERYFPREKAYESDLLKWLLREIDGTYRGSRKCRSGAKKQVKAAS